MPNSSNVPKNRSCILPWPKNHRPQIQGKLYTTMFCLLQIFPISGILFSRIFWITWNKKDLKDIIDTTNKNHSYWSYLHQLNAKTNGGTTTGKSVILKTKMAPRCPQMPPDLRLSHLRKRHWSSPRRDRSSPDPLGSAPPTRNAPKREENGRFHTEFLGKIVESWRLWKNICQWIGLRENLQETMVFTIKYRGFL